MAENGRTRAELEAELLELRGVAARVRELEQRCATAEVALATVEHSYDVLYEELPVAIALTDTQGHLFAANRWWQQYVGYAEEEMKQLGSTSLYADPAQRRHVIRLLQEQGRVDDTEVTLERKNGSPLHLLLNVRKVVWQGRPALISTGRDITRRKQEENRREEAEALVHFLLNAAPETMFLMDLAGTLVAVNEAMARAFDHPPGEMIGRNLYELLPPEAARSRKVHLDEAGRTGLPLRFDDGRGGRLYTTWVTPIRNAQGAVDRLAVFGMDVTEWRQAELEVRRLNSGLEQRVAERTAELQATNAALQLEVEQRRRAEQGLEDEKEQLAVTLRSIGDGVITTDTAGRIVLMNRMAEFLTGWTQEQAASRQLAEVFHVVDEQTRQPCEDPVANALRSGSVVLLPNRTLLLARDGVERMLADSGAPIRDREGKPVGVVLVFSDVTEQERLRQELHKMQRLESIGLLAGGVAHDFNNLLTAILGNITLALLEAPGEGTLGKRLADAEKATQRARGLTHQLLTFAKGGAPIRKPVVLGPVILEAGSFALRGSDVQCEYLLAPDLWPVLIDEGQISQVVSNLVINADEAMPDGGRIRVAASNALLGPERPIPLPPGRYVEVAVTDRGVGIPPEYLPRIFEPYFTTKKKGSGLGLTTCYSIVHKHDGHMTAESAPGEGTTIRFFLPAAELPRPEATDPETGELGGSGAILLMDDDPMVRDLAAAILQRQGYEVQAVGDGEQAVEAYAAALQRGRPPVAVILDLTVPGGMGGKETMRRLLELDPQVRALVSSGYSTDPVMADFRAHGFRGVVAKPYTATDLARAVRRLL